MPDAIAGAYPGAQKPRGSGVDRRVELRVGQAHVLLAADERRAVGEPGRRALEMGADRVAEQWRRRSAVAVGHRGHGRIVHRSNLRSSVAPLGSSAMSTTYQPTTADDVKAIVDEHAIRFIRFWFHRHPRPAQVVLDQCAELDDAVRGRDGLRRLLDHRLQRHRGVRHGRHARPATFAVLPWRPEAQGVGRMFCDVLTPERTPYEGDPATSCAALSSAPRRWASTPFNVGPELEYFLFKDNKSTEVLDEGGYFDLTRSTPAPTCAARRSSRSSSWGIHVEYTHHEVGPSQHEIDMRYANALKMADDCMTVSHHGQGVRHEVRLACDVHAQAALRRERLGMHTHMSLFSDGQNAMFDGDGPYFLSDVGKAVHRRPAQARTRDLLDLRPVGELV
jgi:hypothetical protein